jgi:hypothetical protein
MMQKQRNNCNYLVSHRLRLIFLPVGFCILLVGCFKQTNARSLAPFLMPKENTMSDANRWVMPKNTEAPTSIAFTQDQSLWVANWSDRLLQFTSRGMQSIAIKLKAQDSPSKISYVAAGPENQVWVMLDDGIGQVGLWSANQSEINPVSLAKEPRQIAWVKPLNALWYIATDLSLNAHVGDKDEVVDSGQYSALAASKAGDLVAVRQSRTDDILMSSTNQTIKWKTIRSGFRGEIVGFGPDNALLLLQVGLGSKTQGGQFSDSKILSIHSDGTEVTIESGQIIMAKVQGNKLATVWQESSGDMMVKLSTLK